MKDLFSKQSEKYARFRPEYPQELYSFLLDKVSGKNCAWDCATGNGQVAKVLAGYFQKVMATDISSSQLVRAPDISNVEYIQCAAEQTPFSDHTIDLITVAQALHWFDFDSFYTEVRRVAKPNAILAVWGYGLLRIDDWVDPLVSSFYLEKIGPYWDKERRHIDESYNTIPFPFAQTEALTFEIQQNWHAEQLKGYLESWTAVQHYKEKNGIDPVRELMLEIEKVWPVEVIKTVRFPVFFKCGKI